MPAPGDRMTRIRRLRLLATVPVLLAGVVNTGYQYLAASPSNADSEGWRDRMLEAFTGSGADPGTWAVIAAGLVHVLPVLGTSLLVAGIWERLFSEGRQRPFDPGFIYIAILFTLLMHPAASLIHVAFGLSFGMVFARGIFGGEGRTFLSPVLVGVAVVQVSFPATLTDHPVWSGLNGYSGTNALELVYRAEPGALAGFGSGGLQALVGNTQGFIGTTSIPAILAGGLILMVARVMPWRLVVAHGLGVMLTVLLVAPAADLNVISLWAWHMVLGSLAFGVIFLATDPSSASATPWGHWIQGTLAGVLVVLFRTLNPGHPDGVVQVLLLVSMLVPLIDHGVIWCNIRQREIHRDG